MDPIAQITVTTLIKLNPHIIANYDITIFDAEQLDRMKKMCTFIGKEQNKRLVKAVEEGITQVYLFPNIRDIKKHVLVIYSLLGLMYNRM